MSVKLIVVALLAAAVTTVSAAGEEAAAETTPKQAVVTKVCGSSQDCTCDDPTTTSYSTTCPDKAGEGSLYWMADNCTDQTEFVVKGFESNDCQPNTQKYKKCNAASYHQAKCSTEQDGAANSVTLITGCTSDSCTDDADGCSAVTFTDTTCQRVGKKYYKLMSEPAVACATDDAGDARRRAAVAEATTTITFEEHVADGCSDKGVEINVPKECAGRYQKVSCQSAEPSSSVLFEICSNNACDQDCTTVATVSPGQYTESTIDGKPKYLYIDECKPDAADADSITFKVYSGLKKFKKGCHEGTDAECTESSTTTSTTSSTTTSTTTSTTSSTTSTTTTTSSNSSSNSSSDANSNNTTTSDDGIIAPAHSVGVLALVLCVLACVY